MIDAHCHAENQDFVTFLAENEIPALINCASLKEFETIQSWCQHFPAAPLFLSGGIHPWNADKTSFLEMQKVFEKVPVIGEIGLDNSWCNVDLEIQQNVFEKQLQLATELKKPVLLHTKGMENEVATLISNYPNHYLVHWYSALNDLEKFLSLDCYFTVGPDLLRNQAVELVAKKCPLNRILIETDGLSALEWCMNRKVILNEIPDILKQNLQKIAQLRGKSVAWLEKQMEENFFYFCFGNIKTH